MFELPKSAWDYPQGEVEAMFCTKKNLALKPGVDPRIPAAILKAKIDFVCDNSANKDS